METSLALAEFEEEQAQNQELTLNQITQLIQSAEIIKQHLETWQEAFEKKLTLTEQALDKQLLQIQSLIGQFNKMLQAATNQNWQETTETINAESKQQTRLVQDACAELKNMTHNIHARAERITHQITKTLNQTVQGLHAGELQQLVEDSAEEVKKMSAIATQQIEKIVQWFHWKNLGLVFLLSLIVTVLVSLYIDDEWPWEMHKTVVKERLAGQAVLNAWPHLTQFDRQQILDDLA